jgi:hypothetical protein
MIRIRLTWDVARKLEAEFRATEDRKLRNCPQIVLLAHKGRNYQDIAANLCIIAPSTDGSTPNAYAAWPA